GCFLPRSGRQLSRRAHDQGPGSCRSGASGTRAVVGPDGSHLGPNPRCAGRGSRNTPVASGTPERGPGVVDAARAVGGGGADTRGSGPIGVVFHSRRLSTF